MLLILGGGGIANGIKKVWPMIGVPVKIVPKSECDVVNSRWVEEVLREDEPAYVVNCAGIDNELNAAETIATNLLGSLNVAKYSTCPTILIGSVAGLYGKPYHASYCASKAGVISVAQSYAMQGSRIWTISPGRVDTKMRDNHYPDDTPGSRLTPEQIGMVVVDTFLNHLYEPGTNIVIRKEGLDTVIVYEHKGDGWKERLRVGEPVTI